MPEALTDAKQGSDSSTETPIDANAVGTSTTGSESDDPQDTLDLVSDILEVGKELEDDGEQDSDQEEDTSDSEDDSEAIDSTDDESDEEEESTEDTDNEEEEVDEDEFPDEFHEHPRFKQLVEQKNEARKEALELKQKLEFQQQTVELVDSVGRENVDALVEFLTLKDSDPAAGLQMIKPILQEMAVAAGLSMSTELRQKVEEGLIDESTAKDIAKKEAELQNLKQRTEREKQMIAQQSQAKTQQEFVNAASQWELKKKSSDPDYETLRPFVTNAAVAKFTKEGRPDAKEITSVMDGIYNDIRKQLKGTLPKRKATKKSKPSSKTIGKQNKQFSSIKDIVEAGLK
jgi:hypothetical protein